MVTFYRKAQINNSALGAAHADKSNNLSNQADGSNWIGHASYGVANADDDLPYIVVRPKVKRNDNSKKIRRMRSYWD